MAKPKHGRWNIRPSDAHHPLREYQRHATRSRSRVPSPAVLSALAVIATSPPPVAGGPLPLPTPPPTFLCPFIDRDVSQSSYSPAPAPTPRTSTTPAPSPTPTLNHQLVADKYVQGSDNLWRKTDAWTLFGSTWCPSSTAKPSAEPSQPSASQTPMPTPTHSSAQFDTSVLPAGWDSASSPTSNTESTTILALAIVLAGSICVFMIGCVVWRRRKKKTRDIEHKVARKLGSDGDSQGNPRGKMRMWARATARWKSNVRHAARRRRKRPMLSSPPSRPPSPTFSDSPQISVVAPSLPPCPTSFVSGEMCSSAPENTLPLNGNIPGPPAVLHASPRSPSPPTYGASFVSRSSLAPTSAVSNSGSASSSDGLRLVQCSNHPSSMEYEPIPYIPPIDGHVATDDKAHLARIQELASSPPSMTDTASAGTTQPVSAPEWDEIEVDPKDLGIDLPVSPHDLAIHPSFPPPPSKIDLPLDHMDDLSLRYGEGVSLPLRGSSRPSFEDFPSAPPIDDPGLEPSVPSLDDEDDILQGWDGVPSYIPEIPSSADLGTPARATESTASSSISLASSPSTQSESAAGDGVLPRYHP